MSRLVSCIILSLACGFAEAAPSAVVTAAAPATPRIDLVRVSKAERRMELLSGGKVVQSFHIALGRSPIGHKQQQGDNRTPEGSYTLDYRNPNSAYHRSIHISYPNARDRELARKAKRDPGGDVMIHGLPPKFAAMSWLIQQRDWTYGCIALANEDMDVVWKQVKNGTRIEIRP